MAVKLSPLQIFQREKFFLSSAIKGLGANKTIEAAKKIGLPIRRTDGLALYRNYKGIPAKAERMKYVRKSYRFSADLYTEQKRHMTRRYRYTMEYDVRIKETGKIEPAYRSIISDSPITPGGIQNLGDIAMSEWYQDLPGEIVGSRLHMAEHRKGDPWDI